ncbi:Sphingosine N-acyltransferase lag1 [Psilocybe cubensis]|nr:Sphingosine N-acyltransferase lag1 [Psilocybe cubensis]KAH9482972.1 Sphingosine N-acyltransferase lag1 [Psilocybe cubensis]
MAILRDAFRLLIFEPFARWKLFRDLRRRRQAQALEEKKFNGSTNGQAKSNGHIHATNGNGHPNGSVNGNGVTGPTPKELRQLNHKVLRFAEQGWSVVYYTLQWSFGLYVHYNLPTRMLDPTDLWVAYPHKHIAAPVKIYYLTQNAFYLHQILVINAEARRKDHIQMMSHHIITIFLMVGSYFCDFTRVGCVIMVLMDCCDIFLPLAKMIRYLEISQLLCDMTFGVFMISWLITRHILFNFVIYSTIYVGPQHLQWLWDQDGGHYVTKNVYGVFCVLLVALELIQVGWFWLICKVVWRVLTTKDGATDVRSDDEDDLSEAKED